MTWTGKPLSVNEDVPWSLDPEPTPKEEQQILEWASKPVPVELKSSMGRFVRRWQHRDAQQRDWSTWDLEHPYVPHPKEPGVAPPQAHEYPASHIAPVGFLQGADKSYAEKTGIPASGDVKDFQSIVADPVRGTEIGKAYDALPVDDPTAHAAYSALADEVGKQYEYMTNSLGIKVDVTSTDPYPSVKEMVNDVQNNHHISVLSTATTGPHPFFTNEQNDQFRAVHDVFGHAMTGRGFDRNGEEAAWTAHSQMFSPLAKQAMTSETRGQNSAMVWGNGEFQPQKVALLPQQYVERMLRELAELRNAGSQSLADADNLYKLGHSHHTSNGRHFPVDYIAPEDRYVSAESIQRIEDHVRAGSPVWEIRELIDKVLKLHSLGVFKHQGVPNKSDVSGAPMPEDAKWNKLPVQKIKIEDLHPTQLTIDPKKLEKQKDPDEPVKVAKDATGKHYLIDGHHRTVLAHNKGKTTVNAKVFNTNKGG